MSVVVERSKQETATQSVVPFSTALLVDLLHCTALHFTSPAVWSAMRSLIELLYDGMLISEVVSN